VLLYIWGVRDGKYWRQKNQDKSGNPDYKKQGGKISDPTSKNCWRSLFPEVPTHGSQRPLRYRPLAEP
jgi:hypothetical protein